MNDLTASSNEVEPKGFEAFLDANIFHGLTDLRPWFDAPAVKHFSPSDFRIVVGRCSALGITICGVEVFASDAGMIEVRIAENDDPPDSWCLDLIDLYASRPGLSFAASYRAPKLGLVRSASDLTLGRLLRLRRESGQ